MIEFNITLLYQIGAFFILLFILNYLLYKPVLGILEERKDRIAGVKGEAESLEKKVRSRLQEYENRLQEAKLNAQEERMRLRQEGSNKGGEVLDEARKETLEYLANTKDNLEREMKGALEGAREDSKVISRDVVELLIGRKVA
ncbi:MAG: ATP synthase F0 subunit B [Deltaproteobacteria bacterium]|nr:ATP synthase F0 subunit B [Deltaproteobacteria bacterium]